MASYTTPPAHNRAAQQKAVRSGLSEKIKLSRARRAYADNLSLVRSSPIAVPSSTTAPARTIPALTSSAQQKVFVIPELIENILALADVHTVVRCQRVNRLFYDTIKISKEVKKAMWLLPNPKLQPSEEGKVWVNPLLLHICTQTNWDIKRIRNRADYPEDILLRLIDGPGSGTCCTKDYQRTQDYVGDKEFLESWGGSVDVAPALRPTPPMREIDIKEIDIVTNRVRFLKGLLKREGTWKDMILFQPNPWKETDSTFGYWVYEEKSSLDVFKTNGGKWAKDATLGEVLKMVLRRNRDVMKR